MLKFFSYSSCSTCKKAIKWLQTREITFELIDIIDEPPTINMLIEASKIYGDRKYLLNTSGASYRSIGAKVIKELSDKDFFKTLFDDPKLIKRPFLFYLDDSYLIGFQEEKWADEFAKIIK